MFGNSNALGVIRKRKLTSKCIPSIQIYLTQGMKRGDFKLIFLLAAVLHWCGGEREVESYLPKTHPDCDKWAATDNECINNPRFMWSGCLGSCLQHSVDDDEKVIESKVEVWVDFLHLHVFDKYWMHIYA